MAKKMETAVAVNGVNGLFSDLFAEVNFDELDISIENLGKSSKNLDEHEKTTGSQIVSNWEKDVINRIDNRISKVTKTIQFFDPENTINFCDTYEQDITPEMEVEIAKKTKTTKTYDLYIDSLEKLREIRTEKPEKFINDEDISYEDNAIAKKESEIENIRFNTKYRRTQRAMTLARGKWITELSKIEEIRLMVSQLKSYKKKAGDFKLECRKKSDFAKLSINISDDVSRESLKDILKFSFKV